MASAFLNIINIRSNNDYCHQAMLHGHDMKKHLLNKKQDKEVSDTERAKQKEAQEIAQRTLTNYIQEMRHNE